MKILAPLENLSLKSYSLPHTCTIKPNEITYYATIPYFIVPEIISIRMNRKSITLGKGLLKADKGFMTTKRLGTTTVV